MANIKALHSFVSFPGRFGPAKSDAPTLGRTTSTHEHSIGDSSASPLTPTSNQAFSLMKTNANVGAHHVGFSTHYDMTPHDRRRCKNFTLHSVNYYTN